VEVKLQKGKATQPINSAFAQVAVKVADVPVERHTWDLMSVRRFDAASVPAVVDAVSVRFRSAALSYRIRRFGIVTFFPVL